MKIQIKTGLDIDRSVWSEFVETHPKGNVFQTPEMYDGYSHTLGHKPLAWAAFSSGKMVGILLAVILEEKGMKAIFSRRSLIIGGPLVKDDKKEVISALLEVYDNEIAGKVIYSQIINHWQQLLHCDLFEKAGYKFENHLNILAPLGPDDEMWGRVGKGHMNQIQKAQKNDLRVDVYAPGEISEELLYKGYRVIEREYRRARLPFVDVNLLKEMNRAGRLVLFVVGMDGVTMGCRFGLVYGKTVYGWYAGSYNQFYNNYSGDFLIWETLRWCAAHGYKVFDYCGAMEPTKAYGDRLFTHQMGGELVSFGLFEKIYKPIMYLFCLSHLQSLISYLLSSSSSSGSSSVSKIAHLWAAHDCAM